MNNLSPKALIVGAGPAGLLLAHYLLARHYRVEIYDRRPNPRTVSLDQQRSFPISLQERGRSAIRGIPGLEDAISSHSIFCKGTMLHSQKGVRDIPRQNEVMTIDRNQLVLTLLEELTARYSQADLLIKFDCTCENIDDKQQVAQFKTAQGETFSTHYERLIGADGARSRIRQHIADCGELRYELSYVPDAYKSLYLSRKNPEAGVELANDRIHASNLGKDCRIILAPQPGDRLHGAFIFGAGRNPLQSFTQPAEVLDYFETAIPAFRPLLSSEEAAALIQRPIARLLTVRCNQFHEGDRILLIGDAAHAVSPSIGQGCNSALEDTAIINQLLDETQDHWSQAIARFSQNRVADAHALVALSNYSFPRSKWLIPEFLFRLTIGRKLNKWFPQWFQPFVFDLVMDSAMPYSEVLRHSKGWISKVERFTDQAKLANDRVIEH